MSFWSGAMDLILTMSQDRFGQTTAYQRPGFDSFPIVGMPEFVDRLEDPSTGPFYSIFYRINDFDAATFTASVSATFTGAPNSNGMLVFDGITYTSQQVLDNSIPNQFFRGSSALAAAESLSAAINALDGYAGSAYSAATVAHPTCTATYNDNGDDTAFVRVAYKTPGTVGDVITAEDHMSFVSLDSKVFYGGLPEVNDLISLEGTLYRVSDVPEPDTEGGIHIRLEKKAL
jgi:hypothetical protein